VLALVIAAAGFGAGWFLRGRTAAREEAARDRLDVLVNGSARVGADCFVLVMMEKDRTKELPPYLTKRMAEDLTTIRQRLNESHVSNKTVLSTLAWSGMFFPNLADSFRRSGAYLARHGEYPEAVRDAEWLAKQLGEVGGS